MKRERQPTPEEFEKLLAWFHSDPDEAACIFTRIQSRLIKLFAARGCVDSEALADEVLNRVTVRIDTVTKNYSEPLRCCLGFVENVCREYQREQQKILAADDPPSPRPSDELEKEDECLQHCLERLTPLERDIFKQYFQGEKRVKINGRKQLAARLRLTANALRIRAHHVRKEMQQCIVTCLSQC